jgi:membrane associated rhomboid family serine protease
MVLEVVTLSRIGVAVMALIALGFGVSLVGAKRLWNSLTDRFVYGVPWGSLLVIASVFAFYLFAQGGLRHWDDPVVVAFRNWAYPYVTGLLTSGFAHASPSHLLGNMLATVVLAPLAEFIWGHYSHENTQTGMTKLVNRTETEPPSTPEPTEFDTEPGGEIPSGRPTGKEPTTASASQHPEQAGKLHDDGQHSARLRNHPAVRALVIFPLVVLAVSLLTSLYALGWSLGFSGTVFAFLGFVLLRYPITTAVALLVVSLLNTLLNTLLTPVLRATAESGPPQPPAWAGVNVQAHMLGFLIGVLLALTLLWSREELPDPARLFGATVLVASVQGLWQLSTANDGVFVRYQGIGIIFVLLLAVLVTYVTVNENTVLTGYTSTFIRVFGALWVLGAVAIAGGTLLIYGTATMTTLAVAAVAPLLVLPGAVLVVPDGVLNWPTTTRRLLFASLLLITVVIALPSVGGNAIGIDGDAVPDGAVGIEDYHVSYAENASHGRIDSNDSGLVVASEQRYVWTVAVREDVLAHDGTATVSVGGVGWRETVRADRAGWNVVGNDSVYVVDLETDGTSIRSFTSDPSRATVTLADSQFTVVATDETFQLNVIRNGGVVGSTPLPATNETVTVDNFEFSVEERDGTTVLSVSTDDSRVVLAQKE